MEITDIFGLLGGLALFLYGKINIYDTIILIKKEVVL